jgi:ribosome-associated protein
MNPVEQTNDLPLSKTRRKKQAKDVEMLAHRLVELPLSQFARLRLDAEVAAEVETARATDGRGSHKRQVKHLAALLRQREEQVRVALEMLEEIDQVRGSEKRQFHQLEEIRDRLCAPATFAQAFDEMIVLWPTVDRGVISRLARSVHTSGDKRAYREIFKRLRELADALD